MYKFNYMGLNTAHLVLDNENSIFIPNGLSNPLKKKEHDIIIADDFPYEQDYDYIFTLELANAYFIDDTDLNNPLISKKISGKYYVSNMKGTIILVKDETI